MLDVFQGSQYASDLVFGILTLLVYYCKFIYRSYLIHLQILRKSIFGQLWLAASLNKRDNLPTILSRDQTLIKVKSNKMK